MIESKRQSEFPMPAGGPPDWVLRATRSTNWWGLLHCGWTVMTPWEAVRHSALGGIIILAGGSDQ